MISSLNEDEKEVAAQSSYHYFISSTSISHRYAPENHERDKYVLSMAKRHLVAEDYDTDKAQFKMKQTIQFRKKMAINNLRSSFAHSTNVNANITTIDSETQKILKQQLHNGNMFVRGYDKTDRAVLYIIPRNNDDFSDSTAFFTANVYLLERALACSERRRRQRRQSSRNDDRATTTVTTTTASADDDDDNDDGDSPRVIVAFDFNGFVPEKAPPLNFAIDLLRCLKDHYPERLEIVYMMDAPIVFRAFWMMIKPFIDPVTVQKIKFVTGEAQKMAELSDLIDEDEAMPFFLPGGMMVKPFDVDKFLGLPFDHAYDDVEE